MTKPEKVKLLTIVLYVLTWLSLIGLGMSIAQDYSIYNTQANSAPFFTFVLLRVAQFGSIAAICYFFGRLLKNQSKSK